MACEDCAVCSLGMCILKKLYEIIYMILHLHYPFSMVSLHFFVPWQQDAASGQIVQGQAGAIPNFEVLTKELCDCELLRTNLCLKSK